MRRLLGATDFQRAWLAALLGGAIGLAAMVVLTEVTGTIDTGSQASSVVAILFMYPPYTAVYVAWGAWSYARLSASELREVASDERREGRSLWRRVLGMTGTVNVTIGAAVVAVLVTIAIARTPAFGEHDVFVVLGLLTVASSWVLMVFSFAQAYVRLAARAEGDVAVRFPFTEQPRFGDYLTLAVLFSTMAAAVSADVTTRPGWRLVRTNVLVAFAFNSVIIAMMVSLLFGGFAA